MERGVNSGRRRRDRGIALIVVLFLSAVLTLLMYSFLQEMQVEYSLATSCGREAQARQIAWSAVEKAIAVLAADKTSVAGPSSPWFDKPDEWYEIELGDGVFSAIRMSADNEGKLRYGIVDEASKLNLNFAPRSALMKLPKMTDEIADSILDWRDADDTPLANGAENAYYQALPQPYKCKNAPFETVEELLLVRGVTPEILYGEDWNQNGILDANENDGDKSPPTDNADGVLDLGLIAYLTVHSSDRNIRNDGTARINVNTATPEQIQQGLELSAQELQRVMAARTAFGQNGFPTVAHLMPSIPVEKWKQIVDRVTVSAAPTLPGLVNVNTAPKKILEMLPSLTADDVSKLASHRTQEGADLSTLGWLADLLPPEKLQAVAGFVTTRAFQYRLDIVARIGPKSERAATATSVKTLDPAAPPPPVRVIRRLAVVIDRSGPAPRVIYSRDISRLGQPYPIEEPAENSR